MGLGLEKCCCFIPLRLGTLFIAIWFFVSFDIIDESTYAHIISLRLFIYFIVQLVL